MKTFLREVMIVRENFGEAFTAHHLHGDAIRQAVFLVGTGLVERQGVKKR